MLGLLLLAATAEITITFVMDLVPPIILSFETVENLGYVSSFAGSGTTPAVSPSRGSRWRHSGLLVWSTKG